MSSFNPYQQGIQWGNWGSDLSTNIIQAMLMKKMFPMLGQGQGQQGQPQLGQTAMPPLPATAQAGAQGFAQNAPGGVDYTKLLQILSMLK